MFNLKNASTEYAKTGNGVTLDMFKTWFSYIKNEVKNNVKIFVLTYKTANLLVSWTVCLNVTKIGERLINHALCRAYVFLLVTINKRRGLLVDSFYKFISACYLYELALLVQAACRFSSQIGTFQTTRQE